MSLGWLYGKITDARNASFDNGKKPIADLGARTISIGNVTTGGTGKTPLVIHVSEMLIARGKRVCVLTRGYGRKNAKKRVVVSDGRQIVADVENAGDEPMEIAVRLLGKAIVIADADRAEAGTYARENFGVNAFVLDDGFQHRQVRRDLDIVCIDASDPFGNRRLLPFGRLREKLHNLDRADAIMLTRGDLVDDIGELKAEVSALSGEVPIFVAKSKLSKMTPLARFAAIEAAADDSSSENFASLAHSRVFAFCGIGNSEAFFRQLERDNFDIAGRHAFADHYLYDQKDMHRLVNKAERAGASILLTTAKDAVKLASFQIGMPCFVVESSLVIDDLKRFGSML